MIAIGGLLLFVSLSLFVVGSSSALALSSSSPSPSVVGNTMIPLPRRILVTGANRGIGLALTKQLVSEYGCHVYLGSRDKEMGERAAEEVRVECKCDSSMVECLEIDVGDPASVRRAASDLTKRLGDDNDDDKNNNKLYAIVNNAGAGFSLPPSEILDVNARGPRRVVDAFLPLVDANAGRIVNVGSGGGPRFFETSLVSDEDRKNRYLSAMDEGEIESEISKIQESPDVDGYVAYRGSKALLACYTMDLAAGHPDLLISIITPGWIRTRMTEGSAASKDPSEGTVSTMRCLFDVLPGSGYFWGSDGKRSPLHKMRNPGEPEYDGALPEFARD